MKSNRSKLYTLTPNGLSAIRQSCAFRALTDEKAEVLVEFLMTSFGGLNHIPIETVEARLETLVGAVDPIDDSALRRAVIEALETV